MEFHGQDQPEFKGSKHGRLYLTTHRMIFNTKESKDKMQSFSFPFVTLKDVSSVINVVLGITLSRFGVKQAFLWNSVC
jgi:hypothetical protein